MVPIGNAGNITAYWMGYKQYGKGLPRILGGQAQGREKPDLEIDVVGQTHQAGGDYAADGPQGQGQQNRDGNRPALVKSRQTEEDDED